MAPKATKAMKSTKATKATKAMKATNAMEAKNSMDMGMAAKMTKTKSWSTTWTGLYYIWKLSKLENKNGQVTETWSCTLRPGWKKASPAMKAMKATKAVQASKAKK